jgi:hypothetical protein
MPTEKIDDDLWDQCREVAEHAKYDGARPAHLGTIDGLDIMLVDGAKVKISSIEMMDFHEAGNGFGWEKDLIPKGEVWLDDTTKPEFYKFDLYHELFEIRLMKTGLSYDAAHARANVAERILRKRWGNFGDDYQE